MLSLSAAEIARPPAPAGFAWWYCDLTGDDGEGLVLIWSVGLPFVPPGAHDAEAAALRPSCALSVYRGGREHFYLLTAPRPETSRWDPAAGDFQIDQSHFRIRESAGEVHLEVELDAPIPSGGRVRGRVELRGRRCALGDGGCDVSGPHVWAPLATACEARARLDLGDGAPLEMHGRGYLDGNRSDIPLGSLGIADWRWGRIAFSDRELVYFLLAPQGGGARRDLVLTVSPDGATRVDRQVGVHFNEGRASLYGLRRARALELRASSGASLAHVRFTSLVDDGPFYQRYLVDAVDCTGARGRGVAERLVPPRVGLAWQRPFVEMRLDRRGAESSRWLPLFSGLRHDRLQRLLSSWTRRGAPAS